MAMSQGGVVGGGGGGLALARKPTRNLKYISPKHKRYTCVRSGESLIIVIALSLRGIKAVTVHEP